MQQRYVIGNWKSNKTAAQARDWAADFARELAQIGGSESPAGGSLERVVVLAPPTPLLGLLGDKQLWPYELGVQDISPYDAGSYTGAVCARNLEGMGVGYAIIGHSERREYFAETHTTVAQKVTQALSHGIVPIVCVDTPYITQQAAALDEKHARECIIAYEPLGAIGTGSPVSVGDVQQAAASITEAFKPKAIVYGGSVTADTVSEYLLVSDGVLVGGASLVAGEFAQIVARGVVG